MPGGYPSDPTTTPNDSLARVNGSGNKVGPALVLKVMSGDKVDIAAKSFYRSGGTAGNNTSPITDLLGSLAAGIVGTVGESKGALSALNNSSTSPLLGALNSFHDGNNPDQPSKPKAYLNWILLDEQFNYVAASSGADAVKNADAIQALTSGGLVNITQNGFLYIYVSNETQNWDVFFDNLAVKHYTGPITEETHYYPFGLTMAGISSKAFIPSYVENDKKYNGIEFEGDIGLDIYDAQLRELDPQTGRWWQIDPKTENMEMWSPYASNYDNPIRFRDPLGDEGDQCCGFSWDGIVNTTKRIIIGGTAAAVGTTDNLLGTNIRGSIASTGYFDNRPNAAAGWNAGLDIADIGAITGGKAGEVVGTAIATTSVNVTVVSGGLAAEISVPTALAGGGIAYVGNRLETNGTANFLSQNGRVPDPKKVEERAARLNKNDRSGEDFTKAGKEVVIDQNKIKNNGQTVCENCGTNTVPGQQGKKGVTPPKNETHVDHKKRKSEGGRGNPDNGQVYCRDCNLKKH